MACKNCGHDVDNNSKYCTLCGQTIQGCTIEDFLNDHFRIFAVIGVFGAIALYLASFAESNGNNLLLQAGSLLSLSLVVLLSIDLVFRISPYIRNCSAKEEDIEESYRTWFKLSWDALQLHLFRWVFLLIFGCVALFLLFYSEMNNILLSSLGALILILIMIAGIYRPAVHAVKTNKRYQVTFFMIVLASLLSFIYYLWYILSNISTASFQIPIPFVLAFTIYGCYCAYKDRVNESRITSSSVEEDQHAEKKNDRKSDMR